MQRVLGILGTGLIGSSIALRLRGNGWRAIGYDREPRAVDAALEAGAIDAAVTREELYARSDVVVLAPHIGATITELQALADGSVTTNAALVIDIASVKAPIAVAGATVRNFVPTHPMAGRERSGAAAADATLFEERTWAYVAPSEGDLEACVRGFIEACGGKPLAVDAVEHDRVVTLTSHVPQLLATLFAGDVNEHAQPDAVRALCGPTANELLRLSRSSYAMWGDIFAHNAENVARTAAHLAGELLAVAKSLHEGQRDTIAEAFERAKNI